MSCWAADEPTTAMKYKSLLLLLVLAVVPAAAQQVLSPVGQVAIAPYLPANNHLAQTRSLLLDKMRQLVTAGGVSSIDLSERFIITAHAQPIRHEQTATIPQKTALQVSVTFYIGNAIDGKLFSSYNLEIRGIGSNDDMAMMNAIRKISPSSPELKAFVADGKQKIEAYYNELGPSIVAEAKGLGTAGSYSEAVETLLAIPATCAQYAEAQQLIGVYGGAYLSQVRREYEAQQARQEAREQRQHEEFMEMLRTEQERLVTEQARHQKEAVVAESVARVAVARYNSRPRRVYHIHWW